MRNLKCGTSVIAGSLVFLAIVLAYSYAVHGSCWTFETGKCDGGTDLLCSRFDNPHACGGEEYVYYFTRTDLCKCVSSGIMQCGASYHNIIDCKRFGDCYWDSDKNKCRVDPESLGTTVALRNQLYGGICP